MSRERGKDGRRKPMETGLKRTGKRITTLWVHTLVFTLGSQVTHSKSQNFYHSKSHKHMPPPCPHTTPTLSLRLSYLHVLAFTCMFTWSCMFMCVGWSCKCGHVRMYKEARGPHWCFIQLLTTPPFETDLSLNLELTNSMRLPSKPERSSCTRYRSMPTPSF